VEVPGLVTIAVAGVAIGAAIMAVYLLRAGESQSGARRSVVVVLTSIAGLGAAVVIGATWSRPPEPQAIDARRNPFAPTSESLALGERVYRAHCQICHGADGYGNGPAATGMYPPPTDFVVHFASGHTHPDGRLYYWITHGIAGTAMPAFGGRLSDAESWHVVNFLRTFTPTDR
jgi:mono/diheme cytochrome c family protein